MRKTSKRELIVMTWQRLGACPVGRRELSAIQKVLTKELGEGAVGSPASIARLLADAGAELKHPEVIEFDVKWREAQFESEEVRFATVSAILSEPLLPIEKGEALIRALERLRSRFEEDADGKGLQRLRTTAIEARQLAQSASKDKKIDELVRRAQKEIAQWLDVWLQTPDLFGQWLELRKHSPEFRKTFEG